MTYRSSLINDTRVIIVHTVDIGPYLDFGSIDSCTDQRSGIVASTTLQIVYFSVSVAANVSLCDVNLSTGMQFQLHLKFLLNIYRIGLRILIGTHIFQSRKQNGLHTTLLQVIVHHGSRDQFSLCQNHFLLKQREKVFGIRTDVVKMRFNQFLTFLFILGSGIQLIHMLFIFSLQLVNDFVGTLRIFLVQIVRNFHQCISCARHSREYNYLLFTISDQFGYFLYPRCRTYGSTSKL